MMVKKRKKKSEPQPQIQTQSQQQQQEAKPEEEVKIPPMMVLPYEFNAAFVRLLLLIFKGIYTLIRGCCGGNKK